jgi:hypothetical protein
MSDVRIVGASKPAKRARFASRQSWAPSPKPVDSGGKVEGSDLQRGYLQQLKPVVCGERSCSHHFLLAMSQRRQRSVTEGTSAAAPPPKRARFERVSVAASMQMGEAAPQPRLSSSTEAAGGSAADVQSGEAHANVGPDASADTGSGGAADTADDTSASRIDVDSLFRRNQAAVLVGASPDAFQRLLCRNSALARVDFLSILIYFDFSHSCSISDAGDGCGSNGIFSHGIRSPRLPSLSWRTFFVFVFVWPRLHGRVLFY